MDKIFKTMALFVGSREAEQCRSHHQKMEKKYFTFFRILHYLRNTFYSTSSLEPMLAEMDAHNLKINDQMIEGRFIERNLDLP